MYGQGLLKGFATTLKHFVDTWTEDIKWLGNRYTTQTFALRQGDEAKGVFTVEYPEEKIAVPERFRFVPFLVVNNYDDPYAPGDDWCTSCGICAKVCPPQCIWIVRGSDPDTGRPVPKPEQFYIDIDICMNCGYCAEYCPFDAIKMDHDYELASYDRTTAHIHDKKHLSKEVRYWQMIAPTRGYEEAQARGHWEHTDVAKVAKKAGIPLPEPTWENIERSTTVLIEKQEEIQTASDTPALAAGAPAAKKPVAAGFSGTKTTPSGDPLADVRDTSLTPALRAQAALDIKKGAQARTLSISSPDRKAVAEVVKFARAQGLTLVDVVAGKAKADAAPKAAAAPAAPTPAPAAEAAPAEETPAQADASTVADMAGLDDIKAAKELEIKGKNKEIKLTGPDRKMIAAAKKAAKDMGLEWDEIEV